MEMSDLITTAAQIKGLSSKVSSNTRTSENVADSLKFMHLVYPSQEMFLLHAGRVEDLHYGEKVLALTFAAEAGVALAVVVLPFPPPSSPPQSPHTATLAYLRHFLAVEPDPAAARIPA
jgi:hypothetical protein